jgi:hypothetical protein
MKPQLVASTKFGQGTVALTNVKLGYRSITLVQSYVAEPKQNPLPDIW